jgi:hypothetical protein
VPQNRSKRDSKLDGTSQLRGWPGLRTREGRSGLDPVDTSAESAHIYGVFIRKLLTLRVRTRNPFNLFLMFVFGIFPPIILPFVFILHAVTSLQANLYNIDPRVIPSYVVAFFLVALLTIIVGAIGINFILSILTIAKVIPPLSKRISPTGSKSRKKKVNKKRKDYK